METKVCTNPDCPFDGALQPLTSFYKQSSQKSGLAPRCKTCIKTAVAAYCKTERGREVARRSQAKFRKTEHARTYKREWARQAYRTRPGYREKSIGYQRQRRKKLRSLKPAKKPNCIFTAPRSLKRQACSFVNDEIKAGRLVRPSILACIICNQPAIEYHHNKGYEREHWLDVIPVCKPCHTAIHWQ